MSMAVCQNDAGDTFFLDMGVVIKSENKGLILTFKRNELVYQVQVCQTNHFIENSPQISDR